MARTWQQYADLRESHVSESGIKGMKLTRTITGTCTEAHQACL